MTVLKIIIVICCLLIGSRSINNIINSQKTQYVLLNTLIMCLSGLVLAICI